MSHEKIEAAVALIQRLPPKEAANDTGDKKHLFQYPKDGNFENVWRWPEIMEAEGVKVRP